MKKAYRKISFEEHLARNLRTKADREFYEEYGRQLEVAIAFAEERERAKLSQAQVAKKIGTKQSNIARIESGEQNLTISMLHKLAKALGRELVIRFV
jgi:HTH-type transcriptional regulator / antitoxin HipB